MSGNLYSTNPIVLDTVMTQTYKQINPNFTGQFRIIAIHWDAAIRTILTLKDGDGNTFYQETGATARPWSAPDFQTAHPRQKHG